MPALPLIFHLSNLAERNLTATATNGTVEALQVVCAWPVSGQYGPGSRVLYYVLIAACVFARKAEWMRNACVAAALLFPAVAAFHGIVLAVVRIDNAVDMDLYGAFQLCSIGILAAPVTVRLSRTYFYDPGRNTIFLWTGLILAGLLSITVSFFSIGTKDCTHDDNGNPISLDRRDFPYGKTTCGLVCSPEKGPHSPMRGGSADNINVVPIPHVLTFGTATLLAAACCIPAILSLVTMWKKILEINWKTRFGDKSENNEVDELIEGTNGATVQRMTGINKVIRRFLNAVEIPVCGGAIIAILIIGERNFFSSSMRYQTEPMATIGQWAPIVGVVLAVIGSLYLLLAADLDAVEQEAVSNASLHHHNPSIPSIIRTQSFDSQQPSFSHNSPTRELSTREEENPRPSIADIGHRRRIAQTLTSMGNRLGNAAHDQFDNSEFKLGKANTFPEIPGEKQRNPALGNIERSWKTRDADGNIIQAIKRENSSASCKSGVGIESSPVTTRSRAASESFSKSAEGNSFEMPRPPSPSAGGPSRGRPRVRRDTLEVPTSDHHIAKPSESRFTSAAT